MLAVVLAVALDHLLLRVGVPAAGWPPLTVVETATFVDPMGNRTVAAWPTTTCAWREDDECLLPRLSGARELLLLPHLPWHCGPSALRAAAVRLSFPRQRLPDAVFPYVFGAGALCSTPPAVSDPWPQLSVTDVLLYAITLPLLSVYALAIARRTALACPRLETCTATVATARLILGAAAPVNHAAESASSRGDALVPRDGGCDQ